MGSCYARVQPRFVLSKSFQRRSACWVFCDVKHSARRFVANGLTAGTCQQTHDLHTLNTRRTHHPSDFESITNSAPTGLFAIALTHFQVSGVYLNLGLKWPTLYLDVMLYLFGIVGLDIGGEWLGRSKSCRTMIQTCSRLAP